MHIHIVCAQHLERLEEARAEKKESDSFRYSQRSGLCVEQNANGRMGSSAKSYFRNNDHSGTAYQKGL